jgi:hypothetical protein
MKKFAFIAAALLATTGLFAEADFEKEGFLTTEGCAKEGAFKDCYMENYACGSDGCYKNIEPGEDKKTPLVLFSHDDGIIYKLDIANVDRAEFDEGVSRNAVSIVGELDASTNTIHVHEFKAPPPPKKSFFKGCL